MAKFSGAKSVAFVLPLNDCEAKQEQNADNKQNNTLGEVSITVKGDAGIVLKTPSIFKVKKNSTWKEVKPTALSKITLKKYRNTRMAKNSV